MCLEPVYPALTKSHHPWAPPTLCITKWEGIHLVSQSLGLLFTFPSTKFPPPSASYDSAAKTISSATSPDSVQQFLLSFLPSFLLNTDYFCLREYLWFEVRRGISNERAYFFFFPSSQVLQTLLFSQRLLCCCCFQVWVWNKGWLSWFDPDMVKCFFCYYWPITVCHRLHLTTSGKTKLLIPKYSLVEVMQMRP